MHSLRRAWLEHCVIFFRRQQLSPAKFLKVAAHFGTPIEYPFVKGIDGFPQITPVVKLEHERTNFGGIWHSDTTYLDAPPMGTLLLALEVPPVGGDTLFANQYLAYETLSDGLKETFEGLMAIASSSKADVSKTREDRVKTDGRDDALKEYSAEHPVVRVHPETGRKALYVNVGHTARFKGWTADESAPFSISSFSIKRSQSSPAGSVGSRAPLHSGIIAARSIIRSTTTMASAGSCIA